MEQENRILSFVKWFFIKRVYQIGALVITPFTALVALWGLVWLPFELGRSLGSLIIVVNPLIHRYVTTRKVFDHSWHWIPVFTGYASLIFAGGALCVSGFSRIDSVILVASYPLMIAATFLFVIVALFLLEKALDYLGTHRNQSTTK